MATEPWHPQTPKPGGAVLTSRCAGEGALDVPRWDGSLTAPREGSGHRDTVPASCREKPEGEEVRRSWLCRLAPAPLGK